MKKIKKLLWLFPYTIVSLSSFLLVSCENPFLPKTFKNSAIEFENFVKKVENTAAQSPENNKKLQYMLVPLHSSLEVYQKILEQINLNSSIAANVVPEQQQQQLAAQIQSQLSIGKILLKRILENTIEYDSLGVMQAYIILDTQGKSNFIGLTSAQEELKKYYISRKTESKYDKVNNQVFWYEFWTKKFFDDVAKSFFETKKLSQVFTDREYEQLIEEIHKKKEKYFELIDKIDHNKAITDNELEYMKEYKFAYNYDFKLNNYIRENKAN
ncbi:MULTISPECIES: hypothetical protein [unclassified Mycoplasma]|uniref:hypothetical protein n=1 Tax=unclassified Mycoplasma TaxID=2683645 RepID=UPI00211C65C5|nr:MULTISPECIES: hypothetical protein [unclassified Mycoplasma]UUM19701.1 hypothetical protein NPA11_02940 [Mycoplasma sp. 1578d]UUM24684.1 hypothetical protein NPA12_03235 [Mycoplasma sp. 3686d]